MSLITARGKDAKESATAQKIDFEKTYIRLKADESVRVRLLGVTDNTVAEYNSHSDFKKGIYTAPCIAPTGKECPYCVASKSGVDSWDKFYPRKRYLITFYDIDSGDIRVWDASKQQGEGMLKMLEEYDENKDDMAFNFKRTGSGASDTAYHLLPILKMDKATKELFNEGADIEVDDEFLGSVLVPRTRTQMIENLEKAGFPVADFFTDAVSTDAKESDNVNEAEGVKDLAESSIESM